MKKVFVTICGLLLAGALALSVVSCVNEDLAPTEEENIIFDIKVVNGVSPDTKAMKTDWEGGDEIWVYFSGANGKHCVKLTYNSTQKTWSAAKHPDETSVIYKNIGTSGIMYAVHFPFDGVKPTKSNTTDGNNAYVFRSKTGHNNQALNEQKVFSYFLSDVTGESTFTNQNTTSYSSSATKISGTITMSLPKDFVYFYIEAKDGKYNQDEKYRLSVEGVKPATIKKWTGSSFEYLESPSGQPMWGYKYGNGIVFAGKIDETWAAPNSHRFIFFSDGDPAITKTFSGKTLSSHQSVKLQIEDPADGVAWTQLMAAPTSYTKMSDGTNDIYWADWNLGATGLDDVNSGEPIRFGEIVPISYTPGGIAKNNDENLIPKNTNLTGNYAIYDAARALLGAHWRMPSNEELASLLNSDNFTRTWLSSGDLQITEKNTSPHSIIFQSKVQGNDVGMYWSHHTIDDTLYDSDNNPYNFPARAFYWKLNSSDESVSSTAIDRDTRCVIRPIYVP